MSSSSGGSNRTFPVAPVLHGRCLFRAAGSGVVRVFLFDLLRRRFPPFVVARATHSGAAAPSLLLRCRQIESTAILLERQMGRQTRQMAPTREEVGKAVENG